MEKPRFHTRQTTFRQLEIFREVAERLSVTEAAHALHLAQSSVSSQLGKLQQALGLSLFEQIGKRLYLTDAGHEVLHSTRELFDALDRLEMRLGQLHGLTAGQLRLGVVTTAKYLVPRLLGPFCQAHPDVEVQFNVANRSEVIRRLQENLDDLYVFSQPPEHLDIQATPLADNPLVVIAPARHPLAGRRNLRWEDLADQRFISREAGSGTRRAIEEHFARCGWALKPHMTIESNEAIKESVAAGLGIAILSRHTLVHTAPGNLVELQVEQFPIPNRWYLVRWRSKPASPVAEAFSRFVSSGASLL
jgi:LysR family transcriptional regulator, low CO2-responsive transcriptional regulator